MRYVQKGKNMSNIKFKFLGTCARDFNPRLQTDLKHCFDKDARRSCSALLEGHILIDCGIHTLECLDIAGIPYLDITDICMTHLHDDHFQIGNVGIIAATKKEPLRLWVSEEANVPEIPNVTLIRMKKLVRNYMGDGVYVTGLYANHEAVVFPQHLFFEKDGKRILYATDGAWIENSTYHHIRKTNIDMIAIDATCGDYDGDYRIAEHNSISMIRCMIPSLKVMGIMDDHTKMYMTHIAPSLHKPHAETEKIAEAMGIYVAYDGLEIEV